MALQDSRIFKTSGYTHQQNIFRRERLVWANGQVVGDHYIVLDPTMFTNIKVVKGGQDIKVFTSNDINPDGNGDSDIIDTNIQYGTAVDATTDDYFKGDSAGLSAVKITIGTQLTGDAFVIVNQYRRS